MPGLLKSQSLYDLWKKNHNLTNTDSRKFHFLGFSWVFFPTMALMLRSALNGSTKRLWPSGPATSAFYFCNRQWPKQPPLFRWMKWTHGSRNVYGTTGKKTHTQKTELHSGIKADLADEHTRTQWWTTNCKRRPAAQNIRNVSTKEKEMVHDTTESHFKNEFELTINQTRTCWLLIWQSMPWVTF